MAAKPDAVLLCVPHVFRRTGETYTIPDWVASLATVVRTDDYGPATKVLGALQAEQDPDTRIIYVDDDALYHPQLVASLSKLSALYPDAALGYSGMSMDMTKTCECALMTLYLLERAVTNSAPGQTVCWPVPGLEGRWGVIVRRGLLDTQLFMLKDAPMPLFLADDLVLGAYFASRGIPRYYVINAEIGHDTVVTATDYDSTHDSLHKGASGHGHGTNVSNYVACILVHAQAYPDLFAAYLKESTVFSEQYAGTFKSIVDLVKQQRSSLGL